MSLTDNIKSLRETINKDYEKPDEALVQEYKDNLNLTSEALKYLKEERGLDDATIEHFNLGYNSSFDAISIPIYKNKELINIKYRLLNPGDRPKYLGEKGAEPWVYNEEGLAEAQDKGGLLIVEGEFDLMSAWQAGITNVISPSSGKDSYGLWIELVDEIPKVYISYDNDSAGKEASVKLANRIGIDKSYEVSYGDVKDANDFFKEHTRDDFIQLLTKAVPYHSYQFKGLGDIINFMRQGKSTTIETELIPNVKIEKDWLMMISGKTNVGKTAYILNIAEDVASQGIPVLIMPFERGIESVGKRFLQVKFDKTYEDFSFLNEGEWKNVIDDCVNTPIYFSVPKKEDVVETIIKSHRLFDTRFVIVDHLDYMIRHGNSNKEAEISNTLHTLKRVAEDYGIVIALVTHIRKIDGYGSNESKTPGMEDMKGSSSLYQDSECVVMLVGSGEGTLDVNIVKNKGPMGSRLFDFNVSTGRLTNTGDDF